MASVDCEYSIIFSTCHVIEDERKSRDDVTVWRGAALPCQPARIVRRAANVLNYEQLQNYTKSINLQHVDNQSIKMLSIPLLHPYQLPQHV